MPVIISNKQLPPQRLVSPSQFANTSPCPGSLIDMHGNQSGHSWIKSPRPAGHFLPWDPLSSGPPPPCHFHKFSFLPWTLGDKTPRPRTTPYLRAAKQSRSWGLGEEDLPGGKVGGLASWRLLSPFGGSSAPLFLILGLPLSGLLRQPHRGSRAMFSERLGSTSEGHQRRLRLCKEGTETY